jgi:hypothetical protein
MNRFIVSENLKGPPVASGIVTGNLHARLLASEISRAPVSPEGVIVVIDFNGVEIATASYIRSAVLWLTLCGRMHAGALNAAEQKTLDLSALQSLNVFPVVEGTKDDVEDEIHEVYARRGLPCLRVEQMMGEVISCGDILGELDPSIARTIEVIEGLPELTAEELHTRFPEEGINVTAWNNRLSELFRLRMVRRVKQGKVWKYRPLAAVMNYGRKVH